MPEDIEPQAAPPVGSSALLAAAVRHEINIGKKQIELLQLRIKEDPKSAAAIKPFGSNLWRMQRRLEKALAATSS